jgi:hypothetical protein
MTRLLILLHIYWASAMHGVDPRIVTARNLRCGHLHSHKTVRLVQGIMARDGWYSNEQRRTA